MHGMILTVLSSAAGSAAGCILSLYLGRPGKRAKTDPFSKRILPLCAGFLLMALAILAAPGILKLILSVFFSAFTLTGMGTAKGLEDRDQSFSFLTSPASPILTCPPAGTSSSFQL